jgi:uncharacterized membrane protein YfcA
VNPAALLALGGVGIGVGFLSGLLGIGGGVLIVPFLYFFYGQAWSGVNITTDLVATVSHATSLFIIVPTALLGTITYSRAKLVAWPAALPIASFSAAAAVVGAVIAPRLPGDLLTFAFGLFLVITGLQMWARRPRLEGKPPRLQISVTAPTGITVGLLSSILGVGGGLVTIPILLNVVRIEVQRVAATSLAVVATAAASGTLTYILNGAGAPGRPTGSFGFVHMSAALPILVGSLLAVRWGTRANQRVNRKTLRWVFGILFVLLGCRLAAGSMLLLFA